MSNQQPTIQTTKNGTSVTSASAHKAETVTLNNAARAEIIDIDDTKETVHQFLDKIAVAKSMGQESVEASEDIIKHYNRNGLGTAEYFIYQGVKVYPKGKTDEIVKKEQETIYNKLHGKDECIRLSGGG